jgi:hypothetical protein
VVVENEVVATQLLEKGKLRKRVTIIPLNKISVFKASAEVPLLTESDIRKSVLPKNLLLGKSTLRYLSSGTRTMSTKPWNSSLDQRLSAPTPRPQNWLLLTMPSR